MEARTLSISKDKRFVSVTSRRIKGVKGLFKAAKGGKQAATSTKQIPILYIDHVDKGPFSRRFLLLQNNADELDPDMRRLVEEESPKCLTIVYSSSDGDVVLESLDVVVPNREQYDVLVKTLKELVILQKDEVQQYTPTIQFLHYHWMGMGKAWHSSLSLNEWYTLAERIQTPVKKSVLTSLFKDMCNRDERVAFQDVAFLLDDVKAETASEEDADPLELVWRELVETDPVPAVGVSMDNDDASLELSILRLQQQSQTISAVAFLSFVRSQQKNYTASLEDVTEYIRGLNRQESLADSKDHPPDRLSKHRFMAWLISDWNDLMDPAAGVESPDTLAAPLSHYWINTSHDTYLAPVSDTFGSVPSKYKASGNTIGPTEADASMYLAALQRGVRCLELDVWDDTHQQPVVARCRNSKSSIPVQTVLKVIRYFLNQNPFTCPIILKIENHCSPEVQMKMANYLYMCFGAAKLIFKPTDGELRSDADSLPSPTLARGKIIVMGKRPQQIRVGCCVMNDDLDDENDGWEVQHPGLLRCVAALEEADEEELRKGTVVGFDTKGPIYTDERNVLKRSPLELLRSAEADAEQALADQKEATESREELIRQIDHHEALAARLTQEAGMSVEELKTRAAKAANRIDSFDDTEKAMDDRNIREEGVEVHEIMPSVMESSQDAYAEAAQEAMQASGKVAACAARLKEAEMDLARAENDLLMSRQLAENRLENARRAAAEARSHKEYADVAKERVDQVRNLLQSSQVQASSAGTVVQTALTEAKISEKRASEAENRASRARMAAEKDRARAEEETKKEEELEQEVSDLHATIQTASTAVKESRARLDKANAMYDLANEQIKLIEKSSNFREELQQQQNSADNASIGRRGGSFLSKHAAKLDEKAHARENIRKASEDRSAVETRLIMLKSKFEEKSRLWRAQANVAAQARRNADRSSMAAEDLEEHAEEEREAAQLRSVARARAVEAVEHRGSQRESVEAQLAEAERAAAEATAVAMQSRNRAYKLEKEIDRLQNHDTFEQAVEERKIAVQIARAEYQAAEDEKQSKEEASEVERRRLETNSSMFKSATRDAASAVNRKKVEKVLQQEAIVAYNATLMLRQHAEEASTRYDIAVEVATAKKLAAEHAKEYKTKMDMLIEIPVMLAKLTLIHTSKFLSWERSMATSSVCAHSFAQNVLLSMAEDKLDDLHWNLHTHTATHLCRIFPPWRALQSKSSSNFDPVFAWSMGCQMVAMNLFTSDENVLVADGRFRQNGSCGYALKPQYLIKETSSSSREGKQTWYFTVLSAYNLPRIGRKIIRPCVRVSLYAGSTTETRILYKTRPANQNGLNPFWEGNNAYTFEVENPSIAMVSFSVWDKHDDKAEVFVAGAALPVSCLREGYRSVVLFDGFHSRPGPLQHSSLLVKAIKR